MDTSKCQALLTVLEKGNLAHAAEELGYTTSGISRMMSSLEAEVGFPLLVRSKTGCSLRYSLKKNLSLVKAELLCSACTGAMERNLPFALDVEIHL